MSHLPEIVVPETKPATEWVRGRALQKVSPQERHARAQLGIGSALLSWARASRLGRVGSEWEFRVTPPGEPTRPLVPDVAYLSYERVGHDQTEAAQIPRVAPDAAVEVLSPTDRWLDVNDKIRVYLACGSKLVLLVDPLNRTFIAHSAAGTCVLTHDDTFSDPSLPGFSVAVNSIFV